MENNELKQEVKNRNNFQNNSQKQIAGAILLAGVLIAGAILLKDNKTSTTTQQAQQQVEQQLDNSNPSNAALDPVTSKDNMLGNPNAKVTFIEYADYQCPYCGLFFKNNEGPIIQNYVNTGKINFVYRDYAFLGPESTTAAEAALCANDQDKFWQYHDYLFSHQSGENQGAFVAKNLESFAKTLGLNTTTFNQCLESGKYTSTVAATTTAGTKAGVQGTPKGFIVKDGKIIATMDGAEPLATVTAKLDAALK